MKAKQFEDDANVKVHRIRITLTSRNVKNLEKGKHCPAWWSQFIMQLRCAEPAPGVAGSLRRRSCV